MTKNCKTGNTQVLNQFTDVGWPTTERTACLECGFTEPRTIGAD